MENEKELQGFKEKVINKLFEKVKESGGKVDMDKLFKETLLDEIKGFAETQVNDAFEKKEVKKHESKHEEITKRLEAEGAENYNQLRFDSIKLTFDTCCAIEFGKSGPSEQDLINEVPTRALEIIKKNIEKILEERSK